MREIKTINITKVNDIYIRVDKIITPCKCIVPNCKETDCYDIQLEQPEGLSFMGGTFCERHLKLIFNISPSMKCIKAQRDTEAVSEFVESDTFKKLMESLDEQDRATKEDTEQFLRNIKK